jgi:hypothetical protein
MELVWLATQNHNGKDVLLTRSAPQGVVFGWGQDLFPGIVGKRSHFL